MYESHEPHAPPDERVERGHEPPTLSTRGVVIAGAGVALLVILTSLLMLGLLASLSRPPAESVGDARMPQPPELPPEQPPLDPKQPRELAELRAAEEAILESYGWIDLEAGVARIPIDRAIRLLADEGLPVPTPPAEPSTPSENVAPFVQEETRDQP